MPVSPEQLQQAVQQAVLTAAQQWQEAAAQMHQEFGTLRTQVQDAQAVPLPRDESTNLVDTQPRVLRRRRRLEGLERCLQKLCVRLFCAAWLTLGEISWTGAQRDVETGRSIVLDTAVLHAG